MRNFSRLVETRIQEAERRGELKNLPGSGKPLPPDPLDGLPQEARIDGLIVRSTGTIPEEVTLLKSIEQWTAALQALPADRAEGEEAQQLRARIRDARLRLSILFENAGRNHLVAALAKGDK
jgi:hypothetical protein